MKSVARRLRSWLLVAFALLNILALVGCGASSTRAIPGADYTVCQGHRWFLNLPASTPGFIDLGTDGKIIILKPNSNCSGLSRSSTTAGSPSRSPASPLEESWAWIEGLLVQWMRLATTSRCLSERPTQMPLLWKQEATS